MEGEVKTDAVQSNSNNGNNTCQQPVRGQGQLRGNYRGKHANKQKVSPRPEFIHKEKFMVANTSIRVLLTAGVANIQDYASIDECIKRADNLLYEGKNLGRDQVLPML